ncbi:hypothetical protein LUZ60_012838 [Juncus effusus]|nr:hypothetical protein LUZ60_012838 [Juncus effusus]
MATSSMHICMDSSDWLKGVVSEDAGTKSSSPAPSGELIAGPRGPLSPMDRRLRPRHDQPLKCPRCDSTHTKFCYYNNYSLTQPRYFCKTCRRYWTKGGSLRNVPVGGGCRKNKRVNPKKGNAGHHLPVTSLQLSFSGMQLPFQEHHNFADWKYNYGGELNNIGDVNNGLVDLHALNALRFSIGMSGGMQVPIMDANQGFEIPFLGHEEVNEVDVKPVGRVLPIEWHDTYSCGDNNRETMNYYPSEANIWGAMNENHVPSTNI